MSIISDSLSGALSTTSAKLMCPEFVKGVCVGIGAVITDRHFGLLTPYVFEIDANGVKELIVYVDCAHLSIAWDKNKRIANENYTRTHNELLTMPTEAILTLNVYNKYNTFESNEITVEKLRELVYGWDDSPVVMVVGRRVFYY